MDKEKRFDREVENAPVPVETGLRELNGNEQIMVVPDGDLPVKPADLAQTSEDKTPGEPQRVTHIDGGADYDDSLHGGYASVKDGRSGENKLVWIVLIVMTVLCIVVGVCSSILTGVFMRRGGTPPQIQTDVTYQQVAAVVEGRKKCIVEVEASGARGSGVITKLENNEIYILTAAHVINGLTDFAVPSVRFAGSDDFMTASVVGYDDFYDIAVIKVGANAAPYEVYQLDSPDSTVFKRDTVYREGDAVVAIGNAMGLGIASYSGIVSVRSELVTVNGRDMPVMRTTAAINAGMSGGALFDMSGCLIGLNASRLSNSGSSGSHSDDVEDTGFVVPVSIVYPVYKQILEVGGNVNLESMVRTYKTSNSAIGALFFSFKEAGGFTAEYRNGKLTVTALDQGSPMSGISVGDVITHIGSSEKYEVTDDICALVGEMLRYRYNATYGQALKLYFSGGEVAIPNFYRMVTG